MHGLCFTQVCGSENGKWGCFSPLHQRWCLGFTEMAMALIPWGFDQGVGLRGGSPLALSLSLGFVVCIGGGLREGPLGGTSFG